MRFDHEKATVGFLCAVLGILALQVLHGPMVHGSPTPVPAEGDPCTGAPIAVTYPYNKKMLGPHECIVQCSDNEPRYILYSNGLATQCQTPPGCYDWGEDSGVMCVPVSKSDVK